MKVDIKYINKQKPRKTMSSSNFKTDIVYPAHSLEQPNFVPYIPKKTFDALVEAVEKGMGDLYIKDIKQ